jgi:hypothetical protein
LLAVISEVLALLFLLRAKKKRENFMRRRLVSLFSPVDAFVLLL